MLNIKTVQMIEVQDWNALVEKTYGRPYNFQQQDGCKSRGIFNLTVPEEYEDTDVESVPEQINSRIVGVSFKAWLVRDPKQWNGDPEKKRFLDLFWHRNFYPDIQMVANDLHERGLLPAGRYLINIDW